MRRFAILTTAVFVLFLLSGCPDTTEDQPAGPSAEVGAAPGSLPGAKRAAPSEGESETETSHAQPPAPKTPRIPTNEELDAALKAKNPNFAGGATLGSHPQLGLTMVLNDAAIEDISPLAGLPLGGLDLARCRIVDISPLEGMPLALLYLENTSVRDLSVLKGMPLMELSLSHTPVEDLGPLKGAPLQKLYLVRTKVTDLSPLAGMRYLNSLWLNDSPVSDITPLGSVPNLVSLTLAGTKVSDLSPLKGLRLARLHIARSEVTDLTPLEWLQLERLVFTPGKIQKGIEHARNMKSIRKIGTAFGEEAEGRKSDLEEPSVFWSKHDADKSK